MAEEIWKPVEKAVKEVTEGIAQLAAKSEDWNKQSSKEQIAAIESLEKEFEDSESTSFKQFEKFREDFADSGAESIKQFKEWQKDAKDSALDRKNKQNKDTRAAWDLRKQLKDSGVTNEDFLAKAEETRQSGLQVNVATAEADEVEFNQAEAWRKRDDQKKADEEKKEQKRQARNQQILNTLKGQLESMGLSQEFAERAAKRAMQMKESVHKWWEDKKEKIAAGAKSILQWLLKGAGLFLLYKLFDFLSKTNLQEIYDIAVKAFDFLWTGMKTLGAWVGGIKVFKWIGDFFGKSTGWKAFKDFWKGIGGKITKAFKNFKITNIFKGITDLFAKGGKIRKLFSAAKIITTGPWTAIITAVKGVFKMITGPFGKEGGIGKAFGKITKFLKMIPGLGTITKFAGGVLKFMGRLFAPVMLVWGIVEAIMAGFGAAEDETGGLGQKILTFLQVGLQTLLDFFIFDLAQMVEDGIKWGIKWVMGLFGFSEAEQEAATDWSIVGAVKDAIFKAIDWVRDLFRFDGKGVSFKGLAPLIDIILFPLNAAFKWITGLFGWDTDKDGKKKEGWSLGGLITSALDKIFEWFASLLDIDFKGLLKQIPGYDLISGLLDGPSKKDIQEDIDSLKSQNESDTSRGSGSRKNTRNLEIKKLEASLAKMATGGTILPGGAAIVGEGSMRGELVVNANSAAKVIPAKQTADMMSGGGMGGGGMVNAPTTIVNSSPSSTTMIAASNSLNPISQKYFRN